LLKSLVVGGWNAARELRFATWLGSILETAAFEALTVVQILDRASAELELDTEHARRILIRLTRSGGRFKSDGELVTLQNDDSAI